MRIDGADAGRLVAANQAFHRLVGKPDHDLVDTRLADLVHLDDRTAIDELMAGMRSEAGPGTRSGAGAGAGDGAGGGAAEVREVRFVHPGGAVVWSGVSMAALDSVAEGSRPPPGAGALAVVHADERLQPVSRLIALDECGRALNESERDVSRVLRSVTQWAVPAAGDGCVIQLVAEDGVKVEYAMAHFRNPEANAFIHAMPSIPTDQATDEPLQVAQSGEPFLSPNVDPDDYVAVTQDRWKPFVERFPIHSYVAVPLQFGGRVFGSLGLLRDSPGRPFGPDDVSYAEALASRAATAIAFAQRDQALRASEERFRRLAENAPDAIFRYRLYPEPVLEYVSPALAAISGYRPDDVEAMTDPIAHVVHPEDRELLTHQIAKLADGTNESVISRWVRPDGSIVWVDNRVTPVLDPKGRLVAMEGISRDITVLKEVQDELAHRALHDPLTGLPNRQLFVEEVMRSLRGVGRAGGSVAVLFVDLDRFKVVNDSLGHHVGDGLLVGVTERLLAVLRPADVLARLSGDEFAVAIVDDDAHEAAVGVAKRLRTALRRPFHVGGHEVFTSASIGIAWADDPAAGAEDLLRHADVSMYRAKADGRDRFALFDGSLREAISNRMEMESALRHALERGELRLAYQPIIETSSRRVVAAEALLRWQRGDQLVEPDAFVGLAEETGLIVDIGHWVIREACTLARAWGAGRAEPFRVHVNVSARQLAGRHLAQDLVALVRDVHSTDVELCLELTESTVMDQRRSAIEPLHEMRAAGVRLAVDDFGTGYSSLAYLRLLPVDEIKIDRSFVNDLAEGTAIVTAISQMAHALGLEVTAEGVETEAQLVTVADLGCEYAQGYLLRRPLSPTEMTDLLSQGQGLLT